MNLLKEVTKQDEPVKDVKQEVVPAKPDAWSVGHLANHGIILSCEGFQIRLGSDELQQFFDIAEDGEPGEIRDHHGNIVLVEPTENSIVLTRTGDPVYPSGVVLDLKTLKEIGIEPGSPEDKDEDVADGVTIDEAKTKLAYRRTGNKIKHGFRVTSGHRKGRVVAKLSTAYKPRAKASTRMKLSIASRKKKWIRVLKSRRTRKKSASKRLVRLNAMKK